MTFAWTKWLGWLCAAVSFSNAAETLAIPDFENTSGRTELQFLGRTLSEALSQPLAERHGFVLVERQRMAQIFQEKSLALSGVLGDSAADAPLRLLSVQVIVLGSYEGTVNALQVQLRILQVSDGRVLGTLSFQGPLEKILSGMTSAADQIEGILHGRAFGFLDFHTSPEGFEIRIDGENAGTSPVRQARLVAGRHSVAVVSAGRIVWSDSIDIRAERTEMRHAHVIDPRMRQGFLFSIASGAVTPRLPDRIIGTGLAMDTELGWRRNSVELGLRSLFTTEIEKTESFPVPYGTRTEERTFQSAAATAHILWHPPQFGPFETGLGWEFGNIWSWDLHPDWRTDLKNRRIEQTSLATGPLFDLTWVGGHRVEIFLRASCLVTVTRWKRDRILRQDPFPIGTGTNLVIETPDEPLLLPALLVGLRFHP